MKKVIVFGCGLMGFYIIKDIISNWEEIEEIVVVDDSEDNLRKLSNLKQQLKTDGKKIAITVVKKNIVKEKESVIEAARGSLVGIGALPHGVSKYAMDICIDAKVNFVDLVYDNYLSNPDKIDKRARTAGVTVIPAMGVAPGLSNLMVAAGVEKFDHVDSVKIYVGGIPEKRVPPLDYKIVFSATSVVDEYIRDARVRRNGETLKMPALSEVEPVSFFSYDKGEFEAFLTDGLSTLLETFPDIPNMEEKTVRWKNHTEKLKFLRDIGLLSHDKLKLAEDGVEVDPSEVMATLFRDKLSFTENDRDVTLMKVEVAGTRDGEKLKYIQEMVDRYDETSHVTSMARTTGTTCSVVAEILAKRLFSSIGFFAPEKAIKGDYWKILLKGLSKRRIFINEATVKI
ncbi:MAG: saccharopine dehydrogenase C-terminal domain-containing protein [Candidatus Parvarchaeota archaeon]